MKKRNIYYMIFSNVHTILSDSKSLWSNGWIKPKTVFYLCLDVTQKCDLQISMKSSFFMKYSNTLMSLDNNMIPWNTVTFFMMSKRNQGKIGRKHCFVRCLLLIIQFNYLFVPHLDSKWAFRFIQYFLSSFLFSSLFPDSQNNIG